MDFKTIVFWILLAVFTVPGFYFGYAKLVATADKIAQFARLGISTGLMRGIGAVEIGANLLLLFPQTRLVGMAIWAAILVGALFANVRAKEERGEIFAVLFCMILLVALFWLNGGLV